MRSLRILFALALALPLMALAAEVPSNLEPLPEAPPPPGLDLDSSPEPEISIVKKGENTVEEYRINGELYMQKITPAHGVPYYLMKEDQNGGWSRLDDVGQPLIIPKWVLFKF